jgi:hypothetical protein
MRGAKRPLSVTILSGVFIAVGAIGFAFHFHDLLATPSEGVWIEVTELLALLCGIFILRGHPWARWGALAWMAFHVVLSAFHNVREFAVHILFLAVMAWILFSRGASRYFAAE